MKRTAFYTPIEWFGNRYSQMYNRISRAPRQTLVTWLAVCKQVSQTNCWWAVYAAANYIGPEIEKELAWRDQKIRRRLVERNIPYGFAGIPTQNNGTERRG